jgi:hypothetical protein
MPLRVSADHSETLWPASSRAWEIPIRVTIPNPLRAGRQDAPETHCSNRSLPFGIRRCFR